MSLVNQMLQELDRRHAVEAPMQSNPGAVLKQGVRPTRQPAVGSEWFWRVLAALMIFALGWLGWVVWQLAPRSNVTELAMRTGRTPPAPAPRPPAAQTPAVEPVPGSPAAPAPGPLAAPAPGPLAAPVPVARPVPAARSPALAETFVLARELSTPIKPRPPRAPPAAEERQTLAAAAPASAEEAAPHAEPRARPPRSAAAPAGRPPPTQGQIDKRDTNTPRERAEAEFRRALAFVNQGRMAEGMEAFKSALALDPTHETARQTQVSLLLDAKRVDEAASSLDEGLKLNPTNATFAILLARIMVDRNDPRGALSLLQKHAFSAENNADYRAFMAALYQRLGLHKEASEEYERALRVAPQNAAWWVGLGISLESQQRAKDAGEAFRRAKASGQLAPELASYVDQKLKSLQ